jgi:hypothetical protein
MADEARKLGDKPGAQEVVEEWVASEEAEKAEKEVTGAVDEIRFGEDPR